MHTIAEIRRLRLEQLISEHGGKIADLNEAIGLTRTDSTLSRIRNANVRLERGKPFQMGDPMARRLEEKLGKAVGWMDNLPYAEDPTLDHKLQHLWHVAQELAPYQVDQAIKIIATLTEPQIDQKTGTK